MGKALDVAVFGAGNRGKAWVEYAMESEIPLNVVAVAEPNAEKREFFARKYNVPRENCFSSGVEVLSRGIRGLDTVIVTSPDRFHYNQTKMSLERNYNVLLEKPMATSPEECVDIVNIWKRNNKGVLSIGHVLRYTPFFQKIKEIIDSKDLGRIKTLYLTENIGDYHSAHSYVRGNWPNSETSSPIILAKSCHDMDMIKWLMSGEIEYIVSEAGEVPFKSGAPKESLERCIDGCKREKCRYDARTVYLAEKDPSKVEWPVSVISSDHSLAAREKALRETNYGECVWRRDNNQPENQEVRIYLKNKSKAVFQLDMGGDVATRAIRIMLEDGAIMGDFDTGKLTKIISGPGKNGSRREEVDLSLKKDKMGHGGGDPLLFEGFYGAIMGDPLKNLTNPLESLISHFICFAAEESRIEGHPVNGKLVDFQKYLRLYGIN